MKETPGTVPTISVIQFTQQKSFPQENDSGIAFPIFDGRYLGVRRNGSDRTSSVPDVILLSE